MSLSKHQSIIRDGNHFVKITDPNYHSYYRDQWFLIDGPWFDYLESMNKRTVVLRPYIAMTSVPIEEDCMPDPHFEVKPLTWEQVNVPYMVLAKRLDPATFEETKDLDRRYRRYGDLVQFNPIDNYLFKRSVFKAWRCNHGELPAYIRNMDWDEHLEQLFTYIYHYMEGTYVTFVI